MSTTVYKTISSQSLPAFPYDKDGNLLMRESETYEILTKKKQALEEKLKLKLQQLKSLCLKEADIIGELPPETPLDPGEPMPQIRRRVGAEFNLNQCLLSKARCFEEENLDKLELDLELQRKIVKANLKLTSEANLKKAVKKKRLQNYQDAVLKLKELEKKLLDIRKKMDEGNNRYENEKARSEINYSGSSSATIDIRPKSSLALVSDIQQPDVDDNDDEESGEPGDSYLSTSAPSTPAKLRESARHIRPISPPTSRYDIRPSSVHFPFEKGSSEIGDHHLPERCKTAEHFSRDYDSCSIGSASSCESSIFRLNNDKKRKNILSLLQSHASDESLDVTSHLYCLPKRNSVIETLGPRQRLGNVSEKTTLSSSTGNPNEMGLLTRHDSLENTRRKSYVSAITSHIPPGALHHHHHHHYHHHHLYSNHKSLKETCEESGSPDFISDRSKLIPTPPSPQPLPSMIPIHSLSINMASRPLPSPPLPPLSINMASRPLPPPPSPSCSSSSSRASPSLHNADSCLFNSKLDESKLYQNIPELGSKGTISAVSENKPDISLKAVRSSIIRTPIAITISTSSTDTTQLANHRLPSPAPNLPPRTPSLSASTIHNDDNIFFAAKATTMCNLDTNDPNHSIMPSPKVWTETDLDSYPGKSERKLEVNKKTDSSYNIYYNDISNEVTEPIKPTSNDYENIEVTDQPDCHSRNSKSDFTDPSRAGPRPLSIPLSPTVPSSTNGVEVNVVSVGHFQPYWEETKPYELADFFKYSAKHRKKALGEMTSNRSSIASDNMTTGSTLLTKQSQPTQQATPTNSNKLNTNMQMKGATCANQSSFPSPPTFRDSSSTLNRPSVLLTNNLTNSDNFVKKNSYKDDNVNWYENDIVKNPTIV